MRRGFAAQHAGLYWRLRGNAGKQAAAVTEMQTESLVYEPETGEQADTILRLFSCRGCGALLDTETALQKEPFLDDTVIPEFLQEG